MLPVTPSRQVLIGATVAVAVLVALVGGTAAYAYAGDVPRGTTVLGVDLGGRSRAEAAQALVAGLGDRLAAPVAVRVGERSATVDPAGIGLTLDVAATVDRAAGNGWPNPVRALFGKRVVEPVVTVDTARLDKALQPTAAKVAQAITRPSVTYQGLSPKVVYPAPGKGLDPQQTADAFVTGWLRGDVVTVPVVDIDPATTREDIDRLVAELARPAVAAPVSVAVTAPGSGAARGTLTIQPQAIAASLVMAGDARGRITPRVDPAKLRAALKAPLARFEKQPKDAQMLPPAGGAPVILASSGGEALDTKALATDLLGVLPQPEPRELTAQLTVVQPKTTSQDLAKLGVKEQVSTFTTYFEGGLTANRSRNIIQVAKEVDGALVKPGQVFSLNGHTGPRGYAEGYLDAPVIVNGQLQPGIGGGVSQFTTTLFNAAYYAGLEDVEHHPHSFYFSRYPPVIESTIFYPDLDMRFRNDSPHGVLIDTAWTYRSITVSIWSTKRYDISTVWSARRDPTQPKVVYLPPGPQCVATEGIPGFTQDAWRIFRQNGKEIRRQKFTWRYDAEPRQICGAPPS
ncbi:MAG TPA: VanW family protein [Micromonosporaceae bacterium]|nr:VanW family protein [Micromonosporaceae bacterium]